MSLLVLIYHRACIDRHGNTARMLDAHFEHLARNYRCVLPGETLEPGRLNVCLSFDDGYFDFYAVIYPLLEKHDLRALLAITPVVVRERIDKPVEARLEAPAEMNHAHASYGGFCTWPELHELAQSGRVMIAAHGYTHCRLDRPGVDLHAEIVVPQTLLAARLGQSVDSFVFPYGRFSKAALQRAREHYRYVFRIGGAANGSWSSRLLYRIDADGMEDPGSLFTPARLAGYQVRSFWNRLRGR